MWPLHLSEFMTVYQEHGVHAKQKHVRCVRQRFCAASTSTFRCAVDISV